MINNPQIVVESTEIVQETAEPVQQNFGVLNPEEQPCIVQIVYPQDLCLGVRK